MTRLASRALGYRWRFALSILFLSLALPVFLFACSAANDTIPRAIRERGVLRVAVFSDKPPFGYVDPGGKKRGYDIELAKRLARDLLGDENKIVFVATTAEERIELLQEDAVDIVIANFTRTEARAKLVDFSLPYMKTALGVISSRSQPILKISDLGTDKKVCVDAGTTAQAYFQQHFPKVPLLSFKTNNETFRALQNGQCAALAHDDTLLYAWARLHRDYLIGIHPLGPAEVIAPAVKKGDTQLLEWLDMEMRTLYAQGFFFEAYDREVRPFFGDEINPAQIVISH